MAPSSIFHRGGHGAGGVVLPLLRQYDALVPAVGGQLLQGDIARLPEGLDDQVHALLGVVGLLADTLLGAVVRGGADGLQNTHTHVGHALGLGILLIEVADPLHDLAEAGILSLSFQLSHSGIPPSLS